MAHSINIPFGDPSGWSTPAAGRVFIGADASGVLVFKFPDGSTMPLYKKTRHAQSGAGGSSISIDAKYGDHLEKITATGSGVLNVNLASLNTGDLKVRITVPAATGLTVRFVDAGTSAVILNIVSDGVSTKFGALFSADSGVWEFIAGS